MLAENACRGRGPLCKKNHGLNKIYFLKGTLTSKSCLYDKESRKLDRFGQFNHFYQMQTWLLSVCLHVCLYVCLCWCLCGVWLSVSFFSIYLSILFIFISISIYLSNYISIYLSELVKRGKFFHLLFSHATTDSRGVNSCRRE